MGSICENRSLTSTSLEGRLKYTEDEGELCAEPKHCSAHSPQGEGSLLVPTHAVPVDGGGTWHSVQMMGAVGQGRYPLAVPLSLLFPGETQREINPFRPGVRFCSLELYSCSVGTTVPLARSKLL